jgi:hypothetical protein
MNVYRLFTLQCGHRGMPSSLHYFFSTVSPMLSSRVACLIDMLILGHLLKRQHPCVFVPFSTPSNLDVGCGPIFSMNTTMGVKITYEMLTNSPAVPLLSMQHISTLWIFTTPHTCARSRRPQSSLQSTNSQWNDRLHLIFRIEITRSQQSGERKILQIETKWDI